MSLKLELNASLMAISPELLIAAAAQGPQRAGEEVLGKRTVSRTAGHQAEIVIGDSLVKWPGDEAGIGRGDEPVGENRQLAAAHHTIHQGSGIPFGHRDKIGASHRDGGYASVPESGISRPRRHREAFTGKVRQFRLGPAAGQRVPRGREQTRRRAADGDDPVGTRIPGSCSRHTHQGDVDVAPVQLS
jgi:hypothetical protein